MLRNEKRYTNLQRRLVKSTFIAIDCVISLRLTLRSCPVHAPLDALEITAALFYDLDCCLPGTLRQTQSTKDPYALVSNRGTLQLCTGGERRIFPDCSPSWCSLRWITYGLSLMERSCRCGIALALIHLLCLTCMGTASLPERFKSACLQVLVASRHTNLTSFLLMPFR